MRAETRGVAGDAVSPARGPHRWFFALLLLAPLLLLLALPAFGQRREFLRDGEIAEIRDATEEPNKRLKLYVQFAERRLAAVEKLLAGSEPERGQTIHDQLYEYSQIIVAIDHNVDQYMSRREIIKKGLEEALKAQPEFLKLLASFKARNPKDIDEYRFILAQAIDDTEISMEGVQEALGKQPRDRKETREVRRQQEEVLRERGKRD